MNLLWLWSIFEKHIFVEESYSYAAVLADGSFCVKCEVDIQMF